MRFVPLWLTALLVAAAMAVPALVSAPGETARLAGAGPAPVPQAAGWTIELVGLHGGSAEPDLALDSAGTPHVLYCPPGDVRFADRAPTGWTNESVVASPGGGVCGELAMGPGDIPHITTPWATAYGGETYGTRIGGVWNLSVYPGGLLDAVNSVGEPQLVTYADLGGGQSAFLYRTLAGGTWTDENVETFPGAVSGSAWASLALDGADNPRILYYDDVRGDVRYAFRNATGWQVEVVEPIGFTGAAGRQGGLALDPEGTAHAAYYAPTGPGTSELRHAVRTGVPWTIEVVDTQASYPDIAIGPDGVPQVAYVRLDSYDPLYAASETRLLHAARAGGLWAFDTILTAAFNGSTATGTAPQFVSMVADRCGLAHLAYYFTQRAGADLTGSGVYYATRGTCDPLAPVPFALRSATLAGAAFEDVTLRWTLSGDDGAGQDDVVAYDIYAGTAYDPNGTSYALLATVPNGTDTFTHAGGGAGGATRFYRVLARDATNRTTPATDQAGVLSRFLPAGRQLLSVPLEQEDWSLGTVLQTLPWSAARTYDAATGVWLSAVAAKPWNALAALDRSAALWVEVTADAWWVVAGIVPPSTAVPLRAGWNLIGFPSFTAAPVAQVLAGVDYGTVEAYEDNPPYHLRRLSASGVMSAGNGYWVYVGGSSAVLTFAN